MPETPCWLVSREDDARDLLVRSRGREEIENEIHKIEVVERRVRCDVGKLTAP